MHCKYGLCNGDSCLVSSPLLSFSTPNSSKLCSTLILIMSPKRIEDGLHRMLTRVCRYGLCNGDLCFVSSPLLSFSTSNSSKLCSTFDHVSNEDFKSNIVADRKGNTCFRSKFNPKCYCVHVHSTQINTHVVNERV